MKERLDSQCHTACQRTVEVDRREYRHRRSRTRRSGLKDRAMWHPGGQWTSDKTRNSAVSVNDDVCTPTENMATGRSLLGTRRTANDLREKGQIGHRSVVLELVVVQRWLLHQRRDDDLMKARLFAARSRILFLNTVYTPCFKKNIHSYYWL